MAASACIALGSNLGDRRIALKAAIRALEATPGITSVRESRAFETSPVGGPPGQGPFLNSAAVLETSLDPIALHARLVEIERQLGRVRGLRWGERSIDLDLLLFDDQLVDRPGLTIPHPRMACRRFVLAPLADVAPEAVDPLTSRTAASLLANLDRRPGCIVLLGEQDPRPVARRLLERIPAVGWFDGDLGSDLPEDQADPDCDDLIQAKSRDLDRARWSRELSDGRWLLTNLDLDQIYGKSAAIGGNPFRRDPPGTDPRRDRFLIARDRTIRPTFRVALRPEDYDIRRRRMIAETDPILRETPLLWPGVEDPEAAFTSRERSGTGVGAAGPLSESAIDAIVSGIVAACEASRAELRPVTS